MIQVGQTLFCTAPERGGGLRIKERLLVPGEAVLIHLCSANEGSTSYDLVPIQMNHYTHEKEHVLACPTT
jgi:hypothetical protein